MEFGLLGPLEIRSGSSLVEIRRGLPRTILSYLLLRRSETVSAALLTDALWGDEQPVNPANALQTQVSYLRKQFAAFDSSDQIVTRPGGYALEVAADSIDSCRFERAVRAASQRHDGDSNAVRYDLAALEDALALWRGPALADVAGEEFAIGEAARLEELRLVAIETRNDLGIALGHHQELAADLASLVNEHPFRERLHGQLMLALYCAGRQADALRAYANARQILVDEIGIEPGAELRDLERRILDQDPTLTPAASVIRTIATAGGVDSGGEHRATASRLPAAVSTLIGREIEIERVTKLLDRSRVVTLTGPAGAGKSRLAIETVRSREAEVWFVDMGDVVEQGQVATLIAKVFDVPTVPGDDIVATLAAAISRRRGLLLLDTCEHVVGTVAPLVARILREATQIRVLATSRRPLNISGEIAWPVPPLALAPSHAVTAEELGRFPSVELFVERAAAVRPDFTLSDDNAADVAAICMAVDGLPLAIELAAARVDVLSPRAITERLLHRFDLLVDGGRDVSPRQQTLRAAVEWSISLLDDSQRTFFARLGVFPGTFDLAAATYVGGEGATASLDMLASLVRQSMVSVVSPDRYRLLDTLAAYAMEMLAGLDADATRTRHAAFFVASAEEGEAGVQGADQHRWLQQLREDAANHRAALEWLVGTGDGAGAARLAGALGWFWTLDGTLAEADRQLERVLEFTDLPPRERSKILWCLALLESSLGRMSRAETLAVESVLCGREADDPIQTAFGLNALAVVQWAMGEYESSDATRAEATDVFARFDEPWGLAVSLVLQTRTAIDRSTPDACELAAAALAAARSTCDRHVVGIALQQAARLSLRHGDATRAVTQAHESLAEADAIGYIEGILGALHVVARSLVAAGEPELAARHHMRALRLAAGIGHAAALCEALEGIAAHAASTGDPARATNLLRIVDSERTRLMLRRHVDDEAEIALLRCMVEHGATDQRSDASSTWLLFDDVVDQLVAEDDAAPIELRSTSEFVRRAETRFAAR